jgi:hypothetical protein
MSQQLKAFFLVGMVLCSLWLAGCREEDEVATAEEKWQAHGISSYQIEVQDVSMWQWQTVQVTVENGVVAAHTATCQPALLTFSESGECAVQPYDATQYTVAGLFDLARQYSEGERQAHSEITFDETYGFPTRIIYTNRDLLDADHSWSVVTFQPRP